MISFYSMILLLHNIQNYVFANPSVECWYFPDSMGCLSA